MQLTGITIIKVNFTWHLNMIKIFNKRKTYAKSFFFAIDSKSIMELSSSLYWHLHVLTLTQLPVAAEQREMQYPVNITRNDTMYLEISITSVGVGYKHCKLAHAIVL